NAEFSFIDLDFHPNINLQQPEIEESKSQGKKIVFTFCSPECRNNILDLVTKHFNQHPLIPAYDRQYYSADQIYEAAVREIYTYCKDNNLQWTWSYLWVEWYCSSKWPYWARSAKKEISVLKTTIIVESHWRLIKHDYLYRFNKPCVDLLIWILAE
ncbi:4020_t:CDS:1, partial [Dentiscutata erythropus]